MRRPSAAREALGLSPLVKAGGTHTSCVEGIPSMSAVAKPEVFLAGRPAAERAADAGAGRIEALVFFKLAIRSNNWVVCEWTHAPKSKLDGLLSEMTE